MYHKSEMTDFSRSASELLLSCGKLSAFLSGFWLHLRTRFCSPGTRGRGAGEAVTHRHGAGARGWAVRGHRAAWVARTAPAAVTRAAQREPGHPQPLRRGGAVGPAAAPAPYPQLSPVRSRGFLAPLLALSTVPAPPPVLWGESSFL